MHYRTSMTIVVIDIIVLRTKFKVSYIRIYSKLAGPELW